MKLPFFDTLQNWLVGMMVSGRDKSAHTLYMVEELTQDQLENAYRSDWIARKIIEIPAHDATREWRNWQAKQKQIEDLEQAEEDFLLQQKVREALIKARLYGGAAIVIGVEEDPSKPIDPEKLDKDCLKFLHVVSRHELVSSGVGDETDIMSPWYGLPKAYTVRTSQAAGNLPQAASEKIHPSRIVRFIGNDPPSPVRRQDGWGDPVLYSVNDAVKAAGSTAQSISQLIWEAKVDFIKVPNLSNIFATKEAASKHVERMSLINAAKSSTNAVLMDKEEEWERTQLTFGGMPDVMNAFLIIAAGAADIPATRLLGRSPAGMNATGDSDTRNYYDRIKSEQELRIRPAMQILDEVLQAHALGKVDENIFYEWAPLWQMDEEQKAKINKTNADASLVYVQSGLVPFEALARAVQNKLIEEGDYPGLEAALQEVEHEADELLPLSLQEIEAKPVPQLPPPNGGGGGPNGGGGNGGGGSNGGSPKKPTNGGGGQDHSPFGMRLSRFRDAKLAVEQVGGLRSGEVYQVVKNTLALVDEAGGVAQVLADYDMPQEFEPYYLAALEAVDVGWTEEAREAALEARRAKMSGEEPSRGVKGLPHDAQFAEDSMKQAIERDTWNMRVRNERKDKWSNTTTYDVELVAKMPEGVKQAKSYEGQKTVTYYDPALAKVETIEAGTIIEREIAKPKEGLTTEITPLDDKDVIYRGMSDEEYQHYQTTGEIKSRGDYNVSGQEGLTYWTTKVDTAEYYANGFQPWQMVATFEHPAWVVAAKHPGAEHVREVKGTAENEVGISRPIAKSEIVAVWRGDVYAHRSGSVDLVSIPGTNRYRMGSRSNPSSSVVWRRHDLQKDVGWTEEAREAALEARRAHAKGESDPLLKDLPEGAALVEGKGPLGAGKWMVQFPQMHSSMVASSTNLHPTKEAAVREAQQLAARQREGEARKAQRVTMLHEMATRLKAGGEVTERDLRELDLKGHRSGLKWFIPAAAELFGVSSRAIRPHIKEHIKSGTSDFGVKYESVDPTLGLKAIAQGLARKHKDDWEESKHPRVPKGSPGGGQFGSGGGGGGERSQTEVEAIIARQREPADHGRSVLDAGRKVAAKLNYDPDLVSIAHNDTSPNVNFTLNGREYKAAGLAYIRGTEKKGQIELFPEQIRDAEMAAGVAAHEVEHHKFQQALDRHQEEMQAMLKEPGPPPDPNGQYYWQKRGGHDAVMAPDGTLREAYASKYPVYQEIERAFRLPAPNDFAKSDGVSDYSFEWWKAWKNGKATFEQAAHETLAEMARLKHETGAYPDHIGERILSWRGEDTPKPSEAQIRANAKIWRELANAVSRVYKKHLSQ